MSRYFFSDYLLEKLNNVRVCPLSALEAPAGYGKTTAVHRILDGSHDPVYWYTAVESMQDTSFSWFVRQIGLQDEHSARKLQDLGYLNRSNVHAAAAILSEMRISEPLTLVFDNFQYSLSNWQPQLLEALATRTPDGLHTIFITQNFSFLRPVLSAHRQEICYLKSTDLLLQSDDIRQYAGQLGIPITEKMTGEILQKTDGWAAAVDLFLENLAVQKDAGKIRDTSDLLYDLFWSGLSGREQEALLRLCLFDCITADMLSDLLPDTLFLSPEEISRLLERKTPLIRYQGIRKSFYPHEILLSFLQNRLSEEDISFQQEVFRCAGDVFRKKEQVRNAVNCYFKAQDDERILSCRLVCLITEDFDGVSYTKLAQTVLERSPDALVQQYPLSCLRLCYALYAGCAFTDFQRQMERLRILFETKNDPQLMGEWHLLNAFSFFPDLPGMEQSYLQAEQLMESPSELFIKEEPFLFGCTSMWYLFYTKPGAMEETADVFARVMKLYNRLTNDHGAGAAEIYRGEVCSVQGRFEESDIQAWQAAFLSEQAGNASVTYGAALLMGINAIYRTDMTNLQKAVDYLENKARSYSFLQGKMLNTYMVETVRGYLLGLMMETGHSALWTQGEADSLTDLTFTNFMIKTCRITDLLLKKEYKRAIASVEASLTLDPRLISTSTRNFMYCGLALCYMAIGRLIKASEYLDMSLTLAGQDRNYTFIACFRKYFQVLFLMPKIAAKHARTIREIKALNIRYNRADETRIFAVLDESPESNGSLTDREREVASLAARGLRNHEIAELLFISENTVKHHLKIAFQKMNIDRRSKLIEMLR